MISSDNNLVDDIFVWNALTGNISRITAPNGDEPNGESYSPELTSDGKYVVFVSHASNLVPNDTNGYADVFIASLVDGHIERVSVSSSGGQANRESVDPTVSGDGRFIAFVSKSGNIGGQFNNFEHVFLHDRVMRETIQVTESTGGGAANDDSGRPQISADGSRLFFGSSASDLVANDFDDSFDIFFYEIDVSVRHS